MKNYILLSLGFMLSCACLAVGFTDIPNAEQHVISQDDTPYQQSDYVADQAVNLAATPAARLASHTWQLAQAGSALANIEDPETGRAPPDDYLQKSVTNYLRKPGLKTYRLESPPI